jgi:ABC-type glycerol-3-phosphate transport system substrate-binding protein
MIWSERGEDVGRLTIRACLLLAIALLSLVACASSDALTDLSGYREIMDYETYLHQHLQNGASTPDYDLTVRAVDYARTSGDVMVGNIEGVDCLLMGEDGVVEWEVEIPAAGLYNIELEYYPIEGRGTTIERSLEVNGQTPFEGARYLEFTRIWGDAEEIVSDNQGNELRPIQREYPFWTRQALKDAMGDYLEPYKFYLDEGINTLTLRSRREPVALASIRIFQLAEAPTYQEVYAAHIEQGHRPASGVFIKLQERDATYRSSSTLSPQFDMGDPTLEPYHPVLIRLNSIGGSNWSRVGEWVRWDFEVPQDGFYKIAVKGKQNLRRGAYSSRLITIDGELPFSELRTVRFPYSTGYEMTVLGPPDSDEPYLFYLTKGKHYIQMEAVLGDLVDLIRTVEDSLYDLNTIYRQIVMITSPTPDPIRTYQLERRIPGLIEELTKQSATIGEVADGLEAFTGQKGGTTVLLRDLSRQLIDLADDPETIPTRLGEFRDNLGSLGTWLLDIRTQPLEVDYIVIASPEQRLPRATPTLVQRLLHEVRALAASYTHDYRAVGDVYEREGDVVPLKVWIGLGRDQAQILKRMIENDFTPRTGITVNLELISMGVLLPATLAGRGPDVAIGVSTAQPINFAFRGGVVDLTEFEDFPEVAARFKHSALVPFMFRDSVYALPDQQPFLMLFYRADILDELGLEVPQTWDDVLELIPILQKRNMDIGLPFSSAPRSVSMAIGDVSSSVGSLSSSGGVLTFLSFLYQSGEELFVEDGLATNLDNEKAMGAFRLWTELYELYNLPLEYSAENRFRTGEMPLIITGYTFYNQMQVFAPELRGKWDFTLVPGTVRADGVIDRSTPVGPSPTTSGQTGTIILSSTSQKEAAWEFVKWWSSTDVQVAFGRQIESLYGPAGRYATANVEAMAALPWSVEEYTKLKEQWEWVRGVPEVPGGYMVGRYLDNAFRRVVYASEPVRDTLIEYNRMINEEIVRKREEFGLPTTYEELDPAHRKLYWIEE